MVDPSELPKLRVEGISKSYGGTAALLSTSLAVGRGEFVTLLGPSGSGKTTLLSLIAGMVEPDQGSVWLDGRDITRLPTHKRGLGMVFQNYALFPHMSVAQNVGFGLTTRRLGAEAVQQRVAAALATVRLDHLAGRLPRALSGGQQQRVALARALAYEPSLVLMDEPLGALDKNLREEMKREIARIHRELGTTVIYVTHDQEEALVLSTRICLMDHARVLQVDTPEDLYFKPRSVYAAEFLGESNLVDAALLAGGHAVELPALGLARFPISMPSGAPRGMLMIRPESLSIDAEPPSAIEFAARVEERVFLGAMTRYLVRPVSAQPHHQSLRVLVQTSLARMHEIGSEIRLGVDPRNAHYIGAEA
jgi:putative spermidine/putrescine transport system ATP-binding protein